LQVAHGTVRCAALQTQRVEMPHSTTYLLGRASTPGVPETRQFLTRKRRRVPVGGRGRRPAGRAPRGPGEARRPPLPVGAVRRRLDSRGARAIHAHPLRPRDAGGHALSGAPEDGRAYAETARFKQQLAGRVGLPTRPTRDIYDVVILGAGPAGLRALGSRTTRASRRGSAGRSSRRESMRRQPDSGRRF
jgi:hypothetical protein